ncbi:MAG: four helix bundle protein [Phycisphaerae bacterium]|nr:four helix bundle protein [Phycisphaerae bacterium]
MRSQKPEAASQKQAGSLRTPAREFMDLLVWQKSHHLTLAVYRLTTGFPKEEVYGLTSQLRRAMVSVPANIAEGFKRRGKLEKLRYLNIAQGSLEECRYYLILAKDLGYGETLALTSDLQRVSRLLEGYIGAIAKDIENGT